MILFDMVRFDGFKEVVIGVVERRRLVVDRIFEIVKVD